MESKRKKILLNSLLVVVILAVAIGTTLKITSLKKSSAVDKVTEKVTLSTTAPTTKAQKENEAINEDGEVVIEENTEDDSNEEGSKEKVSTKNGTTSYSTTERTSVKTQLEEKDSQTTKKNNSTSSSSQKNTTTTKETTTKNAKTYSCTIEIRCDTILNNMGDLKESKKGFVPSNGTVLATTKVEFKKGETAFDILKKACNAYGIQLEYSYTPTYDSYYVEGINNLYEFDCGSQSGWMYKVNGWFPNYGCSSFKMEDGDVMVWCYTCKDLGEDVGCYMN